MTDFPIYEALRNKGYDARGAGIELALSIWQQTHFEREYANKRSHRAKAGGHRGIQTPSPIHHEDDEDAKTILDNRHVTATMRLGGFPRALINSRGVTEWVGADNRRWGKISRRAP